MIDERDAALARSEWSRSFDATCVIRKPLTQSGAYGQEPATPQEVAGVPCRLVPIRGELRQYEDALRPGDEAWLFVPATIELRAGFEVLVDVNWGPVDHTETLTVVDAPVVRSGQGMVRRARVARQR